MRFQHLFIITVFLFSLVLTGCPASQPPATTNVANTAANTAKPEANTGLETVAEKKEDTVNQAETITPTVKAYCDAMTKKDEAALRMAERWIPRPDRIGKKPKPRRFRPDPERWTRDLRAMG